MTRDSQSKEETFKAIRKVFGIIFVVLILYLIITCFYGINQAQQASSSGSSPWPTETAQPILTPTSLPFSAQTTNSFPHPGEVFACTTNDNERGNSDHGTISFIDTSNDAVTAVVRVGTDPYGIAISPDGKKVYVTDLKANNVLVIDTATGTLIDSVPVETSPVGIAVTPDGKKVYVANNKGNSVSVIDTAINKVVHTFDEFDGSFGVAVTPDGREVYVTNSDSSTVSIIDTATNRIYVVQGIIDPGGITVTPDGKKVYVTSGNTNTVYVIDTVTKKFVNVTVGSNPTGITVTPDGKKAYVANDGGKINSSISVIDTTTNKVIDTVPLIQGPYGIAVTPDGKKVYAAIRECDAVFIIDAETDKQVDNVYVKGSNPKAFGQFIGTYSLSTTPSTTPTPGNS